MKKARPWILAVAFLIAVIAWGVMGLKLYDGDYKITTEAYIMGACWIAILICAISKLFTDKCPHCGKNMYRRNNRYRQLYCANSACPAAKKEESKG